jgi:hypothetical protein
MLNGSSATALVQSAQLTAYSNAMAESFFASLEREVLDRRRFKSQAEAKIRENCLFLSDIPIPPKGIWAYR